MAGRFLTALREKEKLENPMGEGPNPKETREEATEPEFRLPTIFQTESGSGDINDLSFLDEMEAEEDLSVPDFMRKKPEESPEPTESDEFKLPTIFQSKTNGNRPQGSDDINDLFNPEMTQQILGAQLAQKGVPQETWEDLEETGAGILEDLQGRGAELKERLINVGGPIDGRAFAAVPVAVFGALGDVIGGLTIGAGKMLLPEQAEQAIAQKFGDAVEDISASEMGQKVSEVWNGLPKEAQQNLKDLGDIGMPGAQLGVGAVAKQGIKAGAEVAGGGLAKVKGLELRKPNVEKISANLRKSHKSSAQMLQSGSKATALGRSEEFSWADEAWAKVIAQGDENKVLKIDNFQKAQEFVEESIEGLKKQVEGKIKPFLKNEVDLQEYFKPLLDEIGTLKQSAHTREVGKGYEAVLQKEMLDLGWDGETDIMSYLGSIKSDVSFLVKRNKNLNENVSRIHQLGAGKKELDASQQIELQALDLLRKGTRQQMIDKTTPEIADLNRDISGLLDARSFLRIQRDRAKNAIEELGISDFWKTMTKGEKFNYLRKKVPFLKDFGTGDLTKLDTKSDILEVMMNQKIRQIRTNWSNAPKSTTPKKPEKTKPEVSKLKERSVKKSTSKGIVRRKE